MPKIIVNLVFPPKLIKKPVIFLAAKRYNLTPNIRRAKITESVGEVTLELCGTKANLEKARRYLERVMVKVEPVVGDIVE